MFIKLRFPFFANFDKKTLRLISERLSYQLIQKDQFVTFVGENANEIFLSVSGCFAQYFGQKAIKINENTMPNNKLPPLS